MASNTPKSKHKHQQSMATLNTSGAIARITKEVAHIQKGTDLSLAVACHDSDVRNVRALIIGPPDTPYEFGFFEFVVTFTSSYPIRAPQVKSTTTNGGKCRFNPNIYNDGKVCLSILGTWHGKSGEEWSSAQGLESVLLSIQSLLSPNPYENEPGHETARKDEALPKAYIAKIRHETLRVAVIQRLEGLLGIDDRFAAIYSKNLRSKAHDTHKPSSPPGATDLPYTNGNGNGIPSLHNKSSYELDAEKVLGSLEAGTWDPFADLLKRRFLWYHDTYAQTLERCSKEQNDGTAFTRAIFEGGPNTMEGTFDYKNLHKRLQRITQALEDERTSWNSLGAAQAAKATQLATQLAFQFKQLEHRWNHTQYATSRMEIRLPVPTNPFTWTLTLFGAPMTNLDGGIFTLTLSIPPDFPASQPRTKVETPIFHHRVASTSGYLCYFPRKPDEIGSHLEAIVEAIEDESPVFDPRAVVNPEAFALFWGGEEKRKVYSRRLRRMAQESCEY